MEGMAFVNSLHTSAQFREEVREMNSVLNAIHAVQRHICREHPIAESVARGICHEASSHAIEMAVAVANGQPHSPFDGLC